MMESRGPRHDDFWQATRMQLPIRIDIELSAEYIAEVWLQWAESSRVFWGTILLFGLGVGVSSGYMTYRLAGAAFRMQNALVLLTLVTVAGIAIIVLLARSAESRQLIRGRIKHLVTAFAQSVEAQYRARGQFVARWTFDECGITKRLNEEVISWEWERVKRVVRRPRGLVLYTRDWQFWWIPFSAVKEDERAALLRLLDRYVQDFAALSSGEADSELTDARP